MGFVDIVGSPEYFSHYSTKNIKIFLKIRNGNPVNIINGLKHWIDFVKEISLFQDHFISKWYKTLNDELYKLGYLPSSTKENFSNSFKAFKLLKICPVSISSEYSDL